MWLDAWIVPAFLVDDNYEERMMYINKLYLHIVSHI